MRQPPNPPSPHVIIVGAGASGILLASALVRPPTPLHVTLVDPQPGRGVAYAGRGPHQLLNTRVGNMSLDVASPSGFQDWLGTFHPRGGWSADDFAPRSLFGDYLEQRLASLTDRTPGLGSTRVIRSRAAAAERTATGWSVRLASGERIEAPTLVLASGLARPRPLLFQGREAIDDSRVQDDPWDKEGLRGLPRGAQVLLIGAGPTAIDVAEAIWRRDPETKVIAVSRHGLLPRIHASPAPSSPALTAPYPTTARELYAKLRAAAEFVEGDGALRHGVFLGLREIGAKLWAGLPDEERLMFLRHFRRYWDVERHRLPPSQGANLAEAVAHGRFELVRGRLGEAKPLAGEMVRVGLHTSQGPRALTVGLIINCTGPEPDPFRSRNALLLDLLAQGAAAADPLGLGLHVDEESAVLDGRGQPAGGLYAMGALTQGRFFEITGIAEIRAQAEQLATLILASDAVAPLTRQAGGAVVAFRATSPRAAWS